MDAPSALPDTHPQRYDYGGVMYVNAYYAGGSGHYTFTYSKVSGYGTLGTQTDSAASSQIPFAYEGVAGSYSIVIQCVVHDTVYGENLTVTETIPFSSP